MNEDIENELRRALRPIDPPTGFAERVLAALPARQPPATVTVLVPVRPAVAASRWQRLAAPFALAASLVVAVFLGQHLATERLEDEQRAGLAASQEVMKALRLASQKLDVAYQALHERDPAPASTDAEESRT